ncbi:MAG: CBS domain-containing protein [Euryarchaeota archaeon]|nr:CBS domain-containing protein [Euryarchaeota archaeon]
MLKNLKVKDIMTKEVITIHPHEDVVFAFEKLMKHKISSLPVVVDEKLVGIVTATDLGHNLILDKYEIGTTVDKAMVKDVARISSEDDISTAIEKMKEYRSDNGIINQLVVVDNNKIKGIVSDGDIIRAIKL